MKPIIKDTHAAREHKQAIQQLQYRLEHRKLCFERAMEQWRIHDANIACGQIAYLEAQIKIHSNAV